MKYNVAGLQPDIQNGLFQHSERRIKRRPSRYPERGG
ncbi:hypothetical protein N875_01655 [Neisseria meningitidis LNP21362]|uniref:Uncharacterized protein n=1 Tax=Neisseria meningitidis alpha275 TaxID=295996 RepID=C6SLC1_NEIME|nr:hypothetical protein N875_01655 [Neisseria meningitidis LNP21362]CBA08963.1 hypothetical protein predicted by Glimmer/Critica [Neisseria meningitidis alpha275]